MNLNEIQQKLKAPKNQRNSFGNYNYRSCEDILEAVKPLLGDSTLLISDEVVNVGDRYYVKATATLISPDSKPESGKIETSVSAYAREAENKKGMDEAQITGAASSYARKYALNGLFAIDDTKDADTQNNTSNAPQASKKTVSTQKPPTAIKTINTVKEAEEALGISPEPSLDISCGVCHAPAGKQCATMCVNKNKRT